MAETVSRLQLGLCLPPWEDRQAMLLVALSLPAEALEPQPGGADAGTPAG